MQQADERLVHFDAVERGQAQAFEGGEGGQQPFAKRAKAALVAGDIDAREGNFLRTAIERVLADGTACWGRFDVRFDEGGALLRLIAWLISRRSRLFRSARSTAEPCTMRNDMVNVM